MKKTFIKNFSLLLLLLFLLTGAACSSVSQDSCTNAVMKEVISPDKTLKAVIFARNCAATTETQISLLPVNDNLTDNEVGNVFTYKTEYRETETASGKKANVEVKWIPEKQIIISFDDFTTSKVGRMEQQVENVKIIYDKRAVTSN